MSLMHRPTSELNTVCVAGLSLSPEHAQLVVLAGARAPQVVLCAEHLSMPEGFWHAQTLVDPQGLGQWLASFLQSRDLKPQYLSLSVASQELQTRMVTLPAELSNEDLAFQITAEMLDGRVHQADQICVDYQAQPTSSGWQDQHTQYRAVMTSAQSVKQLKTLAHHAQMKIHAIEPVEQSEERTREFASFVQRSSVSAAGVLMCDQACGLALAYWDDHLAINFHPLHLETAQRQQRHWAFRMMGGVAAGLVMSLGLSVFLNMTAQATRDSLQDAYAVVRTLDEVRKVNTDLTQQVQRMKARESVWQTITTGSAILRDV